MAKPLKQLCDRGWGWIWQKVTVKLSREIYDSGCSGHHHQWCPICLIPPPSPPRTFTASLQQLSFLFWFTVAFRICCQWYWDYAIEFARWQHVTLSMGRGLLCLAARVLSLFFFAVFCACMFVNISVFIFVYFYLFYFFMDALLPVCFTICLSVCLSVCLITTHTAIVLVFNCFHYSVRFWCSCCVCFYLSTGPPRGWGSRGKCPGAGGPKGAGVKRGESELAEMGRLKL